MKTRLFALWFSSLLLSLGLGAASAQPTKARLLVLSKEAAALWVLDPDSGAVLGRAATGFGPHELAVSSDGQRAFATNYGNAQAPGHTISVIDLAAPKETQRIDLAPLMRPHGAAFHAGKLYVTVEGSRKIARCDAATGKVDWEFETNQNVTHMLLLARAGKLLYTTNIGSDSVSALAQGADGRWSQTVIPVGKGPEGFDLSPDGKQLWVAHSRDGGVSIIDTATQKVVHTIAALTRRSNRLKLTPDGRLALISDLEAGELVAVDAQTRSVVKRLGLGRAPSGILIPPHGGKAYVAMSGESQLAVVDLSTWQVAKRFETGPAPDGMAWVR